MAALLFSRLSVPLAVPINGDVVHSFPLTTEKLEDIYVDARLCEYDPFLADASATLLDHVELEGDPINVNVKDKNGKILDIHLAVEIIWKESQVANFLLQKPSDLHHLKTIDALSGKCNITSVFLRISGAEQFWRIQPE